MSDHYMAPQSILVVDDNEDDYEAIVRAFKKVGLYTPVSLCTTGQAALDFLRQEDKKTRPALIMLDLNMPGMDGLQGLQHGKSDPELKRIPGVIWTTSS